eukprot:SAG11_NODE_35258_length_267_cov_0.928571_1_plen_58_part_01
MACRQMSLGWYQHPPHQAPQSFQHIVHFGGVGSSEAPHSLDEQAAWEIVQQPRVHAAF